MRDTIMRDTITGQRLLREGRQEGRREDARSLLLRVCELRLGGPPAPELERAVERLADPAERSASLPERLLARITRTV